MMVTLIEAATRLGKSPRQVRYLVKQGRLQAQKIAGRWLIDDQHLALPSPQQEAQGRKADRLHQAVEQALATSGAPRAAPSVQQIRAFRALLPVTQATRDALGPDHSAAVAMIRALRDLARGCHRFHRQGKSAAYGAARDAVSEAVVELVLLGTPEAAALSDQLERDVQPAIAGLLARYDRRPSNGR